MNYCSLLRTWIAMDNAHSSHESFQPNSSINSLSLVSEPVVDHSSDLFQRNVDDSKDGLSKQIEGAIFVKNDHVYEKVLISDILWVAADGAYCRLKTIKRELLLCINLSTFQKQMTIPHIIRVHRSYIVNTNMIEAFEPNYLHIQGELIPLGPKFKDDLIQAFPYIDKTGIIIKK